ncbi:hypothetical protein V8D89_013378 [Ganoderma adspersum]
MVVGAIGCTGDPTNTLACGGAQWSVERSGICVQWQWHAVSENTDAVRPRGRPAYMREGSTAQSPFARPRLMFLESVFRPCPLLYGVYLLPPQAPPCAPSRLPNFVSPSDVASRRVRVHAHQHDRLCSRTQSLAYARVARDDDGGGGDPYSQGQERWTVVCPVTSCWSNEELLALVEDASEKHGFRGASASATRVRQLLCGIKTGR